MRNTPPIAAKRTALTSMVGKRGTGRLMVGLLLVMALALASCSSGSSDDTARGTQDTATSATAGEQPEVSFAFGLFQDLAGFTFGKIGGSVAGWIGALIGLPSSAAETKHMIGELDKQLKAVDQQVLAISKQVEQEFTNAECFADKLDIARDVVTVRGASRDIVTYQQEKVSAQTWDNWASETVDTKTVAFALTAIHNKLVGEDRSGVLESCMKVAYNQWDGSSDRKFGDEQAFYGPIHDLLEYYVTAQTLGVNALVTAYHRFAFQAYLAEGGKIDPTHPEKIPGQVCGDISYAVGTSSADVTDSTKMSRRDACNGARVALKKAHERLTKQYQIVGAGYSNGGVKVIEDSSGKQVIQQDSQREFISSVKGTQKDSPLLWVTDPSKYPNGGGTAQAASTLTSFSFSEQDGWKTAATAEWNTLIDRLDGYGAFTENNHALSTGFNNKVGFSFAGYPASEGAAIWMGEETSQFWPDDRISSRGWCLLVPFGMRNDAKHALGYALCRQADLFTLVGEQDPNIRTPETRSGPWLDNSTTSKSPFSYKANYSPNFEWPGGWSPALPPPSWAVVGDASTRPKAVVWPVLSVAKCQPAKTPTGMKPVNRVGVPTMCGDDYNDWLATVLPPLPDPPAPSPTATSTEGSQS